MPQESTDKYLHLGLGEAIRRLLDVDIQYRHGQRGGAIVEERNLILAALNKIELQIGFDCNSDGTPDTVAIFQQSAETSCCRITSLVEPTAPTEVDSSRATEEETPALVEVTEDVPENKGLFSSLFGSKKKDTKK